MFDIRVREAMDQGELLSASPHTSVARAVERMAQHHASAVMVLDGKRLVGIFTKRDVVFRVVTPRLDIEATPLAAVMTPNPRTIGPEAALGNALLVMQECGFRHLPVLEDGKLIGIVSARSAMDPDLEEFTVEASRREQFMRPA
jgi:CBS domain-containing protein